MRLIQLTLGSGTNTQVTTQNIYASIVVFQNNAANNMRIGDNTTTSSKGITLASGSPGGSATLQIFPPRGTLLSSYYVAGTAGQVIDILYETSA
jgi:hypothetical protein